MRKLNLWDLKFFPGFLLKYYEHNLEPIISFLSFFKKLLKLIFNFDSIINFITF